MEMEADLYLQVPTPALGGANTFPEVAKTWITPHPAAPPLCHQLTSSGGEPRDSPWRKVPETVVGEEYFPHCLQTSKAAWRR